MFLFFIFCCNIDIILMCLFSHYTFVYFINCLFPINGKTYLCIPSSHKTELSTFKKHFILYANINPFGYQISICLRPRFNQKKQVIFKVHVMHLNHNISLVFLCYVNKKVYSLSLMFLNHW